MPSNWRRWIKAARYAAYCAAALAAAAVAAALILPEILDTPAVRAEIQRKLSEAVQGEVAWDGLSIRILPSPRGVLRQARVEIPGMVSVRARQIDARLLFWPLLHGRAEITSVSVVRPEIRIDIVPSPPAEGQTKEVDASSQDLAAIYRSVMAPVVGLVRRFAPDTVFTVEDAIVDVRAPGMLPIELRELSVRARSGVKSMELEATTAGNYWSRVKLSTRVEYADLAGTASLDAADIKPQAWLDRYLPKSPVGVALPIAQLRARASTDAKTSVECDFDLRAGAVEVLRAAERVRAPGVEVKGKVTAGAHETVLHLNDARFGASKLAGGTLRYSPKHGSVAGHVGYELDLAQGMDYTRRLVPEEAGAMLAQFQPVTGRAHGRVRLAFGHSGWSVGVDVRQSDVAVQIRDLPGPVRLAGGAVEIDRHSVKVDRVALSIPAGEVLLSTLRHSFKDGATAGGASFDLDLARWLELARRAVPQENRDALAAIQTAAGRVQGNVRFAFGRGDWNFGVDVLKSDASLGIQQLPGPLKIAGWSIEANPASMTINRAAVSLLDASVVASVTFDEFDAGPRARGAIAEGTIGEEFLAWVWHIARLPPHYEIKTPIRVAAPRIAWRPGGALEVQATTQFDAGPSVAVDLSWAPGALDIRRATIKDGRSDAELALRAKGGVLEGRYAGDLDSTSIAAALKRAKMPSGAVTGDLRFTIDREHPQRMSATGHLKGEALDLAPLIGEPLKIERIDLASDETALHVREATVDWAGQRATLRGELRRGASGPVIDAQLDSPGVIVDALLPSEDKTAAGEKPPAAEGRSKQAPDDKGETAQLWPLPLTGRIEIRSDFVQSGRHKVAPVAATLLLEEQRAHIDLKQAQLCGIALPLTIEATPQGYSVSARISAQKQPLEQTARCLSEERVLITGVFDLKADISTRGGPAELVQNLKGKIGAEIREGKVMRFALLGNILSMGNIASLMKPGGAKLDDQGFPYRTLVVAGHFENGRFILEEGAFHSDAVGLAADGWISATDYSSRLTLLVAPFTRVDELVRKVPLLGYIVGGTLTSVPVGVSGDIRDPLVVPLDPAAVTSNLLGIFERTLKLPGKLITPTE